MFKVGSSMDIHKLVVKKPLILGGVKISSKYGALAHSDGDVVFHAITEAIIGALSLGDLGDHFPDDNPKYKNYDSSKFVLSAMKLLIKHKYSISNLDVSIILETPKLKSNKIKIKNNVCRLLKLNKDQVNIKAGTNEGLGDIGQSKAVLAFATILIKKEG